MTSSTVHAFLALIPLRCEVHRPPTGVHRKSPDRVPERRERLRLSARIRRPAGSGP